MKMAFVIVVSAVLAACNLDLPKEVHTSFETITVKKQDIVVPLKFSAQLSEAMNMYNGSQAIIALYIALGGATK